MPLNAVFGRHGGGNRSGSDGTRGMTQTRSPLARAVGLYGGLVVVAGVAFYFLRQVVPYDSPVRYAYALFGPALSLFTHMSYLLFAFQSIFVFPWLLLRGAKGQISGLGAVGFVGSWLAVGWFMYDLF